MANAVIEPTFASESDRLLFLSRLWNHTLTAQDQISWTAFKATKPPPSNRSGMETWRESRVMNRSHYILSKWDSYHLGKVRPVASAYLADKPAPAVAQAREAVRLQLTTKYAAEVASTDVETALLPLVTGLVW